MNDIEIKQMIKLAVKYYTGNNIPLNERNKPVLYNNTELVINNIKYGFVLQTITALANTNGGIIILGLYPHYESKNIIKEPEEYIAGLKEEIKTLNKPVEYETIITNYKRYKIVIVVVGQLPLHLMPVHTKTTPDSRSKIRENRKNAIMPPLYFSALKNLDRGSYVHEMTMNNYYRSKYTNTQLIEEFITEYNKLHKNLEAKEYLDFMTFYTKSRKTILYILSFSLYPQFFYPNYNIEIEDDRTGEVIIVDGCITQMFRLTMVNIKKLLGYELKISYKGVFAIKPDYHLGVIQEFLLNALIHRDYSIYSKETPIHIHITNDSIVMTNPGYSFITGDILKCKNKIRANPSMYQINTILLSKVQKQHGFRYVERASLLYNAPRPLVTNEEGIFRVEIFKTRVSIYKEPYTIENIIRFCNEPRTKLELYQHFFKKEKSDYGYFYKKYIERLVKINVLAFTLPDTPCSKNQKIYSTKEALGLIQ